MTDDQLDTAALVFLEEAEQWKVVELQWDDFAAIRRGSHETAVFKSGDEARRFVKRCAAKAMLRFYHKEQAKPDDHAS